MRKLLEDIAGEVRSAEFSLQKTSDGRLDSAFGEKEVLKWLGGECCVQASGAGEWYDFSVPSEGGNLYVNTKIGAFNSADKLNCKLGIYHCLTGKEPGFSNGIGWPEFLRYLQSGIRENDRDYYFLVINKHDLSDVFVASLRTLSVVTPNGNNLPFQANWDYNRQPTVRSFERAKEFLIGNLGRSLSLRAEAYEGFKRYFPEYLE